MNPCKKTAALHDLNGRCGAGVLVFSQPDHQLLLGKRGMEGAAPGTWAPFGGMVEPGEPIEQAAVRELLEEAAVSVPVEDIVHVYSTKPDPETGFVFHTFAALVQPRPPVEISRESLEFGWFQLNALPTPQHSGFVELLRSPEFLNFHNALTSWKGGR